MVIRSDAVRAFAFTLLVCSVVFWQQRRSWADYEDQEKITFKADVCGSETFGCATGCNFWDEPGKCAQPPFCKGGNSFSCKDFCATTSRCCTESGYCKGKANQYRMCSCKNVFKDTCASGGECVASCSCYEGKDEEEPHTGPWEGCPSNPCAAFYVDWDPNDPQGTPDWENCTCDTGGDSPILVDLGERGFSLTDPARGVLFDIDADGELDRTAWTAASSEDPFLALDRNGDGRVNDASELFGNNTEQPPAPEKNGYLALALFDRSERGGNGDGVITSADSVFGRLLFWVDRNHDGLSQPNELTLIRDYGVERIDLDYRESRRTDQFGNRFRFISRIQLAQPRNGSRERITVDVFFRVRRPAQ